MHQQSDSIFGSVVTYTIAGSVYIVEKFDMALDTLGSVDWLTVGAFILLLSRLAQDVPKAIIYVRNLIRGSNDSSE